MTDPAFAFDNSYARDLPGFYLEQRPAKAPAPKLLRLNEGLAAELGLDVAALRKDAAVIFAGNLVPDGAQPLAQAYAGHQFGGFSAQLGDGRALLLGEVIDRQGRRRDIAFKGSGRTPFSRGGDGKAAVGPVLREYLMGEAMHALGHSHHAGLGGGGDGCARIARSGAAGCCADAGGRIASAGRHFPVLCRKGRMGQGQTTGRLRHSAPLPTGGAGRKPLSRFSGGGDCGAGAAGGPLDGRWVSFMA